MCIRDRNTTAGTGSECTSFYIVTDPVRHSKMAMVDPNCMAVSYTHLDVYKRQTLFMPILYPIALGVGIDPIVLLSLIHI